MENEPKFNESEFERYSRHFNLPEFGIAGQKKLKQSKVLVVGAGGLGCPVLLYLAAAGVGTVGIVDFDTVDLSNLQRQVLFNVNDIGKPKAACAAAKLRAMNPEINIVVHETKLEAGNAMELFAPYDLISDGSDNFPTRYLVNDACLLSDKPNVHGSIFRFEGQVSVFNFRYPDGNRGPHYRDIYPTPPPPDLVQNCAEGGVLGVLPGIIGSIMAGEIIKVLCGIGEPLVGKMLLTDALTAESRIMKIGKNPNSIVPVSLIDYDDFCAVSADTSRSIKEVSAAELHEIISKNPEGWQIIDVREPYEFQKGNIGGICVPLGKIIDYKDQLQSERNYVFVCRSGARSRKAVTISETRESANLYNLKGGLLEWVKNVDPGLPLA